MPELPKTGTSGATRWLTPEKALIQLSLRHKSDDQLWFTFFHETGHVLLHGKRVVSSSSPVRTAPASPPPRRRCCGTCWAWPSTWMLT